MTFFCWELSMESLLNLLRFCGTDPDAVTSWRVCDKDVKASAVKNGQRSSSLSSSLL